MTTRNIPKTVEIVQRRHDTVVELTRQGYSSTFIADKLGITKRSVQRHRRQAGLSQTTVPSYSEAEIAQAQALLEDGASYLEVARTLQRGVEALRKRFPGYGWTKSQACMYGRMRQLLDSLEATA